MTAAPLAASPPLLPSRHVARRATWYTGAMYLVCLAPLWLILLAVASTSWPGALAAAALAALVGAGLTWLHVRMSIWVTRRALCVEWVGLAGLPPRNAAFLGALCASANLPIPDVGISPAASANAFTLGTRARAVVVVTRGLLDALSADEVNAVLAHEIGHVRNGDYVQVVAAAVLPLLLGRLAVRSVQQATRPHVGVAFVAAAAVLGVMHLVSEKFLLLVTRPREFEADAFAAASVGDPNLLATALVKLGAYSARARSERRVRTAAVLGVCGGVALQGAGLPGAGVAALGWEVHNPWAWWKELFSTHPLTAHRVARLNALARARGRTPSVPLPTGERQWRGFVGELLTSVAPWALGPVCLVSAVEPLAVVVAMPVLAYALAARLRLRYPAQGAAATVPALLADERVSPVRAAWVRVAGRLDAADPVRPAHALWLMDRGVPVRVALPWTATRTDQTRLARMLAAPVHVEGWYRRAPEPVLQAVAIHGPADTLRFAAAGRTFGWLAVGSLVLLLTVYAVTFVVRVVFG